MLHAYDSLLDLTTVTEDKTSEVVDISLYTLVTIQCTWTSTTAAGTFKLQVSCDGINYETLSSPTQAVNNDNDTKHLNLTNVGYKKLKVFFDFTSGSVTTLKAFLSAKGAQ